VLVLLMDVNSEECREGIVGLIRNEECCRFSHEEKQFSD